MRDRLRKIIVWFVVLLLVFGGSFGCVFYANHLLDTGAALAAVIALWVVGMIAFAVGIFIFVRKYKDLISVAARAKTDQPASEHVQKVNEEIGNAIEGKTEEETGEEDKSSFRSFLLPFGILYGVLLIALIVSLWFEGLWADILMRLSMFLLCAVAAVHCFIRSGEGMERVRAVIVFAAELFLVGWLCLFGAGRYWAFVCNIVQAAVAIYACVVWLIAASRGERLRSNQIVLISAGAAELLVMTSVMRYSFVSELYMAWILIPAAVVTVVSAVFMLGIRREFFLGVLKRMSELIASVFVVFVAAYLFFWMGAVTANAAFSPPPETLQCEVTDKEYTGGDNQSYELVIVIGEREYDLEVSKDTYDDMEIGDFIEVGYFEGGLGIAYYQYIGDFAG